MEFLIKNNLVIESHIADQILIYKSMIIYVHIWISSLIVKAMKKIFMF
jgi:hypothetical protein